MFCKVDVRWIYVLEGTKRQRKQRGGSLSGEDAGCVLVRGPSAAAHSLPGECPRPLSRAGHGEARRGGGRQPGGERANSRQLLARRSQPCPVLPGPGRCGAARVPAVKSRRGARSGERRPVTPPRGRDAPPSQSRVGVSWAASPGAASRTGLWVSARAPEHGRGGARPGYGMEATSCPLLPPEGGSPSGREPPRCGVPLRAVRHRRAGGHSAASMASIFPEKCH